MNFQFYLEKLLSSRSFQEFIKENKEAYPCSVFFVIDLEGKDNKQHFDYFIPSEKKMFSFKLESGGEKAPVEMIDERTPEKLSLNYNFDFKDIEKIILEEMEKREIKNKIQKMLFSLQKVDNKDLLIGTIFISMMGILSIHIDAIEKKIILFEKKSFLDMLKITKKGD